MKTNQEEEFQFMETRKAHNSGKNPWEKVVANVEIKEGSYQGSRDVGRMRQAIVSRKNDVKQGIISFQ
jgi:hypothetical protein